MRNNAFPIIDGVASDERVDYKDSCRAATTANITLSGTQTIDGVSVVAGNRVLVKNQTTASQNGIYVAASGAWARASDADTSGDVTSGCIVPVVEGTTNGGKAFVLTTNDPIVLGTTALTFSDFAGASITAHEAAADPHTGYQKESEKGAPSGYGSLDANGRQPYTERARRNVVTKNATGNLAATDEITLATAGAGGITLTLPAASGLSGLVLNIKKVDAAAGSVTVDGNGAETIDGAATFVLATQYDNLTIVCDGTGWHIL